MGETLGSPTISMQLQSIAQQAPRGARVSKVMRHTGCRLCGSPLAQAAGDRGTGCVNCARPGLWGGRRVTGAFTRKATPNSPCSSLAAAIGRA